MKALLIKYRMHALTLPLGWLLTLAFTPGPLWLRGLSSLTVGTLAGHGIAKFVAFRKERRGQVAAWRRWIMYDRRRFVAVATAFAMVMLVTGGIYAGNIVWKFQNMRYNQQVEAYERAQEAAASPSPSFGDQSIIGAEESSDQTPTPSGADGLFPDMTPSPTATAPAATAPTRTDPATFALEFTDLYLRGNGIAHDAWFAALKPMLATPAMEKEIAAIQPSMIPAAMAVRTWSQKVSGNTAEVDVLITTGERYAVSLTKRGNQWLVTQFGPRLGD